MTWHPLDNPYKAYVRVVGRGVVLHDEMHQMLREIGGHRQVPGDPAALLTLLDGDIARLEGPDGAKDAALAHVQRYELRMLRAAVWEALEAQSLCPAVPPSTGKAAAGGTPH
jgi:hypothetical protein